MLGVILQEDRRLPHYAGTVVPGQRGRVLCQLRDDKAGVIYGGRWSCVPGGRVEAGESPLRAARRELLEEFGAHPAALRPLVKVAVRRGELRGLYFAFVARLGRGLRVWRCYEGQAAAMIALRDALALCQHPVSLRILRRFAGRDRQPVGRGALEAVCRNARWKMGWRMPPRIRQGHRAGVWRGPGPHPSR